MYENILVPTDGSDEAKPAIDHAIELASKSDATIHALYVIEPDNTTLPSEAMRHDEVHEEYVEWGQQVTNDVLEQADSYGLEGVATVANGVPHERITQYAAENDIDLIVMGAAGRTGLRERLLGSVVEKVVRTSKAPVLTIRDR